MKTNLVFLSFITAMWMILLASCGGGSMSNSPGGNSGGGNSGTTVLSFQVTDSCNDGSTIYYRFFDAADRLQWPSPNTSYYSVTEGIASTTNLQCTTGAQICLGASENPNTDTYYWGVGIDGTESPTNSNTCATCEAATYGVNLICSGSDSSSMSGEPDRRRRAIGNHSFVLDRLERER
jgi:hypothetical protein